jgi:TolB-like protein
VIGKFLRELKRRRVLNTAFLYVVGAWVALQVVEVLAGAGLPPTAMRNLLIILSFGFPIALVVGWFFDISTDGIERTGPLKPGEELPELKFLDHVFLAGLVLVVAIDAYILSFPLPDPEDVQVVNTASKQRTIAVLGFDDLEPAEGSEPVGEAIASELRNSLTRTAGLRVLGPETSKVLGMSGDNRQTMARELMVTAFLLGEVLMDGQNLEINARLIGVPAGNEIWSNRVRGVIGDAISMQQDLLKQIIGAIAPDLDADPVQGPRARVGECSEVYDIYLRGKSLTKDAGTMSDERKRGIRLLQEAVAIDDECAIAWEALASASVDWTISGFAKAGAAARRALELNDSLPVAWTVLAEIAEEEERWNDSEEYFLRALLVDPTNATAHEMYGEALLARGRVKEALRHSLEAYRYEPASSKVSWHVTLAAKMAGDGDTTIKHALIWIEYLGKSHGFTLDVLAEGYLLKGDTERALETYQKMGPMMVDWFPNCVRSRDDPVAPAGLVEAMRKTLEQRKAGELSRGEEIWWIWQMMRCATWLGEADLVYDAINAEENVPTEARYFVFFHPDAGKLRQDPRFRRQVEEGGLLDYWRKWGWSDYCEPDGDSFRCD